MPVPARPSQLVLGERLVHVRESAAAALAERRHLERAALEQRLAALLVAGASAEASLAAELGVELGLGVAPETIGASSPSRIRKPPAVSPPSSRPTLFEHQEVVGVGDEAEPAPVGDSLPVAHAPRVVAHAVAVERPALPSTSIAPASEPGCS